MFYVFFNPEKPFKEYIIIFKEDYKEGLKYSDYLTIYKPIVVAETT